MARTDFAATVHEDRIFALGGRGLNTVESLGHKLAGGWSSEPSMSETRGKFGVATFGGFIVAVGGVGRYDIQVCPAMMCVFHDVPLSRHSDKCIDR